MSRHVIPAVPILILVALSLSFVLSPTASEGGQPQLVQVALTSDNPASCWLGPGIPVPWPENSVSLTQLVYNSQDEEFLALNIQYMDWDLPYLYGQRLTPDGQALDEPARLSTDKHATLPSFAYNPATNRYLGVWSHSAIVGGEIWREFVHGQMFAANLSRVGEPINLGAFEGYWPSVAYNPDDGEFLVVWQEENVDPAFLTPIPTPTPEGATATPTPGNGAATPTPTSESTIRGIVARRVREDGTRVGPVLIPLAWGPTQPGELTTPKVVYNSRNQEYLVVWARSGQEPKLYSLRLGRTGEPLRDPITLTAPSAIPYRPFLVYNNTADQYLLVWADAREPDQRVDVYGILLSAQGEPLGEPFVIRGTAQYEVPTAAVYNPVRNEYLVAWETAQETGGRPALRRLSSQGELIGEPIETFGGVSSLGVNTTRGEYLVLAGYGHLARPLGFDCPPAPTPTGEGSPTPTPSSKVEQWQGEIRNIRSFDWSPYTFWVVKPHEFWVTGMTWVDEHLSHAEIGAEAWVTAHPIVVGYASGSPLIEWVADSVVVLPTEEPATTPTPESSPTVTTTATPEPTSTATATASATASATPTTTITPTATATVAPSPTQHAVYLPYVVRRRH